MFGFALKLQVAQELVGEARLGAENANLNRQERQAREV